jgi:hypothetical protein
VVLPRSSTADSLADNITGASKKMKKTNHKRSVWAPVPDGPLLSKIDLAVRWKCSIDQIEKRMHDPNGGLIPVRLGHRTLRFRLVDVEKIETAALARTAKTARRDLALSTNGGGK